MSLRKPVGFEYYLFRVEELEIPEPELVFTEDNKPYIKNKMDTRIIREFLGKFKTSKRLQDLEWCFDFTARQLLEELGPFEHPVEQQRVERLLKTLGVYLDRDTAYTITDASEVEL